METIVLILVFLAVGIGQMVLGFMGLDYLLGMWAGFVGLGLALILRFTLPISIGSYFGAVEVLGWPWWAGVLVVLPGLLFIIPGLLAGAIADLRGK